MEPGRIQRKLNTSENPDSLSIERLSGFLFPGKSGTSVSSGKAVPEAALYEPHRVSQQPSLALTGQFTKAAGDCRRRSTPPLEGLPSAGHPKPAGPSLSITGQLPRAAGGVYPFPGGTAFCGSPQTSRVVSIDYWTTSQGCRRPLPLPGGTALCESPQASRVSPSRLLDNFPRLPEASASPWRACPSCVLIQASRDPLQ